MIITADEEREVSCPDRNRDPSDKIAVSEGIRSTPRGSPTPTRPCMEIDRSLRLQEGDRGAHESYRRSTGYALWTRIPCSAVLRLSIAP